MFPRKTRSNSFGLTSQEAVLGKIPHTPESFKQELWAAGLKPAHRKLKILSLFFKIISNYFKSINDKVRGKKMGLGLP